MDSRDFYGLSNARLQAGFSKDPSTKVGACILRPDGTLASVGRNGFPKGIDDSRERHEDRPTKLALMIHAEENAIILSREPLAGYTIYVWPWAPCAGCAARIVQSGVKAVVTIDRAIPDRWTESMKLARATLVEGGVDFRELEEQAFLHHLARDHGPG